MRQQKRRLSGTANVGGVSYQYLVELARSFPEGAEPKFWGAGDICGKQIKPEPEEATLADVLHEVLKRANHDPNRKQPINEVAHALSMLIGVAAQMGSIDKARTVGSDVPDLDGMFERGKQALLQKAVTFYETLSGLDPDGLKYTVGLHAKSETVESDILVCFLPVAEPPPPPAGQSN